MDDPSPTPGVPIGAPIFRRATAIYGETAGLRPTPLDPTASSNDTSNWDAASAAQLAQARTYVGIVSDRNPVVYRAEPSDPSNPQRARAWSQAIDAAQNGADGTQLDPRITQFYMRQEGVGPQAPTGWTTHVMLSLGPFHNVGGGDVPRGPETYVDFYGHDSPIA